MKTVDGIVVAVSSPRMPASQIAVGLMAFLTLVDLFAAQAVLPALAEAYRVGPAAMGAAVNASTLGMAIAGLAVGLLGQHLPRRAGVATALALLAIPTALLAYAQNLPVFALLRVAQGVLMATAFALTLAHLSEAGENAASLFAAYVTGNVASNLLGRMLAAYAAATIGLAGNFFLFALMDLAGALLAYVALRPHQGAASPVGMQAEVASWHRLLGSAPLRACFFIGFCILFAFIGTFTYVNFVLVKPPHSLGMMSLGLVYLVFAPALFTTTLAGRCVLRVGAATALRVGLGLALLGSALLLLPSLVATLAGLILVGVGTFFAQAVTTGAVGRLSHDAPTAASGLYLASYFAGGLAGSVVLGQIFVVAGWSACVAGIAIVLTLAIVSAGVVARHDAR